MTTQHHWWPSQSSQAKGQCHRAASNEVGDCLVSSPRRIRRKSKSTRTPGKQQNQVTNTQNEQRQTKEIKKIIWTEPPYLQSFCLALKTPFQGKNAWSMPASCGENVWAMRRSWASAGVLFEVFQRFPSRRPILFWEDSEFGESDYILYLTYLSLVCFGTFCTCCMLLHPFAVSFLQNLASTKPGALLNSAPGGSSVAVVPVLGSAARRRESASRGDVHA